MKENGGFNVAFVRCVQCRKFHDEEIELHPPIRFAEIVTDLEFENCSFCFARHLTTCVEENREEHDWDAGGYCPALYGEKCICQGKGGTL